MNKKTITPLVIIVISQVFATAKNKKILNTSTPPTSDTVKLITNYPEKKLKQDTSFIDAPEFLKDKTHDFLQPFKNGDATYNYEFYDSRDSIIPHLNDFNEVSYISLFKSYTDSQNTYKDKEGRKQYLPVSSIITRYDRVDTNKWLKVDYSNNKYYKLTEFQNEIIAVDTMITNFLVKDSSDIIIYRYYKVIGD